MSIKVGEAISLVKTSLKLNTDENNLSDQFIFKMFSIAANEVIRRNLDKKRTISTFSTSRFCIELEKKKSHECEGLNIGCDVLRTKYKIPSPIEKKGGTSLVITTLDGTQIFPLEERYVNAAKHSDIKKKKLFYGVHNSYVYIWNSLSLKVIQMSAVWENVTEWTDIQHDNDVIPQCNVMDLEIGVEQSMLYGIMELVKKNYADYNTNIDDLNPDLQTEIRP